MAVWLMVDEDIKGGSRDVLQDWKRYPDGSQFRQSRSSQDWKDKVGLSEESKTVVGNTGHHCRSLEWLDRIKENNAQLTRWSLLLQPYQYHVEYRPGNGNGNADGLSRGP